MNAAGIDISRYNISFNPDQATVPIHFAFQKATEGTAYVDLKYNELWAGISQIEMRGAYHYQRSEMSWKAQADHFLNIQAKHDYHMLALDVEEFGNTYSDSFFSDTKRILDYWRLMEPKKKAVLYTNMDGYKRLYYALVRLYGQSIINWLDGIPLWYAYPSTAGSPPLPAIRKTWEIHQHSWNGVPASYGLGGTKVDENIFNGSVDDLRVWLGLSGTTGGEPVDKYMTTTTALTTSLNIRSSGENLGTGNDLGDFNILPKDIIHVIDSNAAGYVRLDALYRNNVSQAFPASPTGQYWALATGYLMDIQYTPPSPSPVPDYLLAHFPDGTTKKYIPE